VPPPLLTLQPLFAFAGTISSAIGYIMRTWSID
jgi:hypothetical protein